MARPMLFIRSSESDEVLIPWCDRLDLPSDSSPILTALMQGALLRLFLLSDGRVASLRERVHGSGDGPLGPGGDGGEPWHKLAREFDRCKTHRRRLFLIHEAQERWIEAAHAPERGMVRGTREWKEAIGGDARSGRVLARVYGVSETQVRRLKKAWAAAVR